MAVFAKHCPNIKINVVDINSDRIAKWNSSDLSELPVYEPGLESLIKKYRGKNLHFSSEIKKKYQKQTSFLYQLILLQNQKVLGQVRQVI